MIIPFTKNPFANPRISEDTFDNLALTHLNRLETNNQNGDFTALITATRAAYNDFHDSLTTEALERAIKEGRTITVDSAVRLLKLFASQKEIDIAYNFRPDTAEYEEFYPLGISEYTNANKKNIARLFERLEQVIQTHTNVLGNAILTELQQKLNAFKTGRDSQLQSMGEVLQYDSESDIFRSVLAIRMFRNLGTLLAMFADNPERLKNFFPEAQSRSSNDVPTPTPTPTPSGVITFDIDETTLQPIFPKIAGNASATGVEQLNFDHGDGYETVYTLQNGILTGFTISFNTAGVYHAEVTEITAGANRKIAVIQFDNCKLSGTLTIPPDVQATNIEVPMNPLLLAIDMQQESYTNIVSFVVFGCGLLSINEHLIGLDNSGKTNGFANFGGGTNQAPSGLGIAAKNSLIAKGWTVLTN